MQKLTTKSLMQLFTRDYIYLRFFSVYFFFSLFLSSLLMSSYLAAQPLWPVVNDEIGSIYDPIRKTLLRYDISALEVIL